MLLCFSSTCFSQTEIKGKIIDDRTGKSVSFAHVFLKQSSMGVMSDLDGEFKLISPRTISTDTMRVTCIGYKTKLIPLIKDKRYYEISLTEDIVQLGTVVFDRDHGKELLIKAVESIPLNYSNKSMRLTGTLREVVSKDSTQKNLVAVSEAELEVSKGDYSKIHERGAVKIISGRKLVSEEPQIGFVAGPHLPHRFDPVIRRAEPISLFAVNDYYFEIQDTLRFMGLPLFKLYFEYKRSNGLYGLLYIQDTTFAIVKAVFTYEKHGLYKIDPKNGLNRQYLQYTAQYQPIDSTWHLAMIHYQTYFFPPPDAKVGKTFLNTIYTTHEVAPELIPIRNAEQIMPNERLTNKIDDYNPMRWKYTAAAPNETTQQYFNTFNGRDGVTTAQEINFLLYKGIVLHDHKSYKEAVRAFTTVIKANDKTVEGYVRRGMSYLGLGAYDSALHDFNKVIGKDDRQDFLIYMHRAAAYSMKNLSAGAIQDFDSARQYYKNEKEFLNDRAMAKKLAGDLAGALLDLDSALSIDQEYLTALKNKVLIQFETASLDIALPECLDYLTRDKNDATINYCAASIYFIKKEYQAALPFLTAAKSMNTLEVYMLSGLSNYYLANYSAAVQDLNETLKMGPSKAEQAELYYIIGISKNNVKAKSGCRDIKISIDKGLLEAFEYYNEACK